MNTLYWISVLGNLNIVAQVALFLFLVAAFITMAHDDFHSIVELDLIRVV